jgi:hypothetical protein
MQIVYKKERTGKGTNACKFESAAATAKSFAFTNAQSNESAIAIAHSNLFANARKFESAAATAKSFAFANAQSNERRK